MEVGGALASAVVAALSVPCLVLLLLLGEAGLRVAALLLRWPTRAAFLGYRIARPAASVYHYHHSDDEPPPPPPECCDPECAFCLSAVRDGDEVRELRCRHAFHRAWLVRPRTTCPLCRDRLLPSADDDELGGYFVDHDRAPSSSAVSAYHADGGALWHMT